MIRHKCSLESLLERQFQSSRLIGYFLICTLHGSHGFTTGNWRKFQVRAVSTSDQPCQSTKHVFLVVSEGHISVSPPVQARAHKLRHVEIALRDGSALYFHHLRVRACTDRLFSPCHHPSVSSLRPRDCLVGRTMAPSQLQAAPTPRRCGRSKDKWTKPVIVVDFAFWHDLKVIFTVSKSQRLFRKR